MPHLPKFFRNRGWTVTDWFGNNQSWRKFPHRGVDFGGVPEGHPIYSPVNGRVVYAGYDMSYGNWLKLKTKRGVEVRTAHHKQLVVTKNQEIKVGDLLAYNGHTGEALGPHIHLEVLANRVLQDPLKFQFHPDDIKEGTNVKFVLVNSYDDLPAAKRLMEHKQCFMAWRDREGKVVGDLSQAKIIYVCGGPVDDLPIGPQIVNLSGKDMFSTVSNIGKEVK
jgi:hypothetical protein